MINSDKLKGRMVEKRVTQKVLSQHLGIAQPTLNQKINNIRPMTLDEVDETAKILCIPLIEFNDYFFYNGCSAAQQSEVKT